LVRVQRHSLFGRHRGRETYACATPHRARKAWAWTWKLWHSLTAVSDLVLLCALPPQFIAVPLPNVSGPILTKVIEYCTHHRNDPNFQSANDDVAADIGEWDLEYCKVDQGTLYELILVRARNAIIVHCVDRGGGHLLSYSSLGVTLLLTPLLVGT